MVRTGIGATILLLSVFGSPAMSPFGREFLSTPCYQLITLSDRLSSRKLSSVEGRTVLLDRYRGCLVITTTYWCKKRSYGAKSRDPCCGWKRGIERPASSIWRPWKAEVKMPWRELVAEDGKLLVEEQFLFGAFFLQKPTSSLRKADVEDP